MKTLEEAHAAYGPVIWGPGINIDGNLTGCDVLNHFGYKEGIKEGVPSPVAKRINIPSKVVIRHA